MTKIDTIQLILPSPTHKDKALRYRQEHFDAGERIINGSELFDQIEDYDDWLKLIVSTHLTALNQTTLRSVIIHSLCN